MAKMPLYILLTCDIQGCIFFHSGGKESNGLRAREQRKKSEKERKERKEERKERKEKESYLFSSIFHYPWFIDVYLATLEE